VAFRVEHTCDPVLAPSPPSSWRAQAVPVAEGWNLVSLHVLPPDPSLSAALATLSSTHGDNVKSRSAFAEYYDGYGWFGSLTEVGCEESYSLRAASVGELRVEGPPVSLPFAIPGGPGWTWPPMPYEAEVALASYTVGTTYRDLDLVKDRVAFAEYYDGYGWFGSLSHLRPGRGYQMSRAGGGPLVFAPAVSARHDLAMRVAALVSVAGAPQGTGVLLALVGSEVRGAQGSAATVGGSGPHEGAPLFEITVRGEDADAGRGVRLIFVTRGARHVDLTPAFDFEDGGRVGNATAPLLATDGE
jgi:hypothetical protein